MSGLGELAGSISTRNSDGALSWDLEAFPWWNKIFLHQLCLGSSMYQFRWVSKVLWLAHLYYCCYYYHGPHKYTTTVYLLMYLWMYLFIYSFIYYCMFPLLLHFLLLPFATPCFSTAPFALTFPTLYLYTLICDLYKHDFVLYSPAAYRT